MAFHEDGESYDNGKQPRKKQSGENIFIRIAKADNGTLNRAQAVLVANGFSRAKNRMEIALKLMKAYKEQGEKIIPALVEIHPDKSFFDEYYQNVINSKLKEQRGEHDTAMKEIKAEKYSNDCGCGGGKKYSNSDGSPFQDNTRKSAIGEHLPYIALTCVVGLLGISMVAIAKSNKI